MGSIELILILTGGVVWAIIGSCLVVGLIFVAGKGADIIFETLKTRGAGE